MNDSHRGLTSVWIAEIPSFAKGYGQVSKNPSVFRRGFCCLLGLRALGVPSWCALGYLVRVWPERPAYGSPRMPKPFAQSRFAAADVVVAFAAQMKSSLPPPLPSTDAASAVSGPPLCEYAASPT